MWNLLYLVFCLLHDPLPSQSKEIKVASELGVTEISGVYYIVKVSNSLLTQCTVGAFQCCSSNVFSINVVKKRWRIIIYSQLYFAYTKDDTQIYFLDKLQTCYSTETDSDGWCIYFITCLLFPLKISLWMLLLPFMEIPGGKHRALMGPIILV